MEEERNLGSTGITENSDFLIPAEFVLAHFESAGRLSKKRTDCEIAFIYRLPVSPFAPAISLSVHFFAALFSNTVPNQFPEKHV
jgi:hypothetical protein